MDCDGDSSVEFILIDRQRTHGMHFQPIPYYHHKVENADEALERSMDIALFNLGMAFSEVETLSRIRQSKRLDERDKAAKSA